MSEINGDLLDDGLQAVMGADRCRNDWKPSTKNTAVKPVKKNAEKPAGREEAMDAAYVQLSAASPMERLKRCAKWALLFGSISMLLFYWQQAGLLDSKAAVPSLIVCALGAGLTVGYNAR